MLIRRTLRVRFVDRCLLELRSSRTEAVLLLPSGFPLQLALPLDDGHSQYGMYVHPALEFAHWAFQTPAQRLEFQRYEEKTTSR